MSRINTNVSSLIAQNILSRSNGELQTALNRLSTGLRINTGKDDPAGLIASEDLRRDITAINKAVTNSERANQLIATADGALGQVSKLLNDIRGLVTEAANDGALSAEQIAANQLEVDSSLEAIDRIAQVTTFQGRRLLDGSLDFIISQGTGFGNVQDLTVEQANLGATGSIAANVNVQSAATQAQLDVDLHKQNEFTVDGQTFTVRAATTTSVTADFAIDVTTAANGAGAPSVTASFAANTLTVEFNTDDTVATVAEVVAAINGEAELDFTLTAGTGADVTIANVDAANDDSAAANSVEAIVGDLTFQLSGTTGSEVFTFDDGASGDNIEAAIELLSDATGISANLNGQTLELTSDDFGSDAFVDVDVISEGDDGTFGSGLTDPTDNSSTNRATGTDIVATINGLTAQGDGNTLSVNTSTLDLSLTVAANTTGAIVFTIEGGGARFQLGPEVVSNQQARLGIGSVNTGQLGGASGRLFELRSGGDHELATDPNGAATIVDEVITKVSQLRGRLGAFQRTTLDTNIASLKETVANLTEAESSIRDADFAAESAALTRAQILVQSGTSVLAIANQNPQNVLALLR